MGNEQIRLRYSGFIVFTTQLLGIVTGLIFTLLLARSMTSGQYGVWNNIFDYTVFFQVLSPLFPFWALRFTARGKIGASKTGILGQLAIAVISATIYLPIIYMVSNAIGTTAYLLIYFITAFYIITFYMVAVFDSVLQAIKPHATGFGFIIQEIVKVAVALLLILVFKQIFLGAILALVIAPAVQLIYYSFILRGHFKEPLNLGYLKQWLKGSPVTIFSYIGGLILAAPVNIFLFLYGGADARAYYAAAIVFTTIVGYAQYLSISLYPRLLAKTCSSQEIGLSFKTVLMLAIPLAAIVMVMGYSFLTVLNPGTTYGLAWPVLIIAAIDALVVLVSAFYFQCLMGVETFDAEGQISLRKMVQSKIFKVFAIPYIQAAIALPLTYYILTQLPIGGPVGAAVTVAAVLVTVHIVSFAGLYYFMRGAICLPVAWASIAKFLGAALVTALVLFLLPTTTTLTLTIFKAIGGFALYVVVLYAIDAQARELVRLIWKEVIYTLKRLRSNAEISGQKEAETT